MHADGDNNKLYYYIRESKQTKQIQSKIFTTGGSFSTSEVACHIETIIAAL